MRPQKADTIKKISLMGILNLTPDSFSGDGIYKDTAKASDRAQILAEQGADILDLGGESTRPGSLPVSADEEIERVIPVVKKLSKTLKIPLSIDTSKSEVAIRALDNGASMINDISGMSKDERMLDIVSRYDAKVIIMHMRGDPQTMQGMTDYKDLIEDIKLELGSLIDKALENNIKKDNIIIDPGIGFGKTPIQNLRIINELSRFKVFDMPILIGTSRKSFIGSILDSSPSGRIFGTAASVSIAVRNGASIIRAHDVGEMSQVIKVTQAIMDSEEGKNEH